MENTGLAKMVLVLSAICLVAAAALSGVERITREPIAEQLRRETLDAVAKVLPAFDDLEELGTGFPGGRRVFTGFREGRTVGHAFEITSFKGYSGELRSMLGVTPDGRVHGVVVLKHAETPGLGAKITKDKHLRTFIWKDAAAELRRNLANTRWKVKKDGGELDQITGATITTRAMAEAVHGGLRNFEIFAKERRSRHGRPTQEK